MPSTDDRPVKKSSSHLAGILLGILFLLPAVLACGTSQLFFSVGTFITSLQKVGLGGNSAYIGFQNYSTLFQDKALAASLGFTALTVVVRLLAVAVIPLLLAWGVGRMKRGGRLTLRLIFTLPVAIFIPTALAAVAAFMFRSDFGLVNAHWLTQPASARVVLVLVDGLYTLGLACGLGLVFFLAALRDPEPVKPIWKPLLAAWGIGLLATVAMGLQSFAWSFVLTNGGPARATTDLMLYLYDQSYRFMRMGPGAALAVLLLVALFLIGLLAGLVIILSGLRIGLAPREAKAPADPAVRRRLTIPALIVGLLVGLPALLVSLLPIALTATSASGGGSAAGANGPAMGSVLVNTFLPVLIVVLFIQLPLSYLGALAIGAFRPLGRFSEWLLLPFSPWLFAGLGGFSVYAYQLYGRIGWLGKFASLLPPLALSVPMLVLLTLFFKGQQAHYLRAQEAGESAVRAFFTRFIVPSLPLAGLLIVAGLFAGLQEPLWSLVFGSRPGLFTLDSAITSMRAVYGVRSALAGPLLQLTLPGMVFFFLAFGAFQIFYLDRLTLSAGKEK